MLSPWWVFCFLVQWIYITGQLRINQELLDVYELCVAARGSDLTAPSRYRINKPREKLPTFLLDGAEEQGRSLPYAFRTTAHGEPSPFAEYHMRDGGDVEKPSDEVLSLPPPTDAVDSGNTPWHMALLFMMSGANNNASAAAPSYYPTSLLSPRSSDSLGRQSFLSVQSEPIPALYHDYPEEFDPQDYYYEEDEEEEEEDDDDDDDEEDRKDEKHDGEDDAIC